jgi:hypothetical protein
LVWKEVISVPSPIINCFLDYDKELIKQNVFKAKAQRCEIENSRNPNRSEKVGGVHDPYDTHPALGPAAA